MGRGRIEFSQLPSPCMPSFLEAAATSLAGRRMLLGGSKLGGAAHGEGACSCSSSRRNVAWPADGGWTQRVVTPSARWTQPISHTTAFKRRPSFVFRVLSSSPRSDATAEDLSPAPHARLASFLLAFYRFSRPHTMAGTAVSILSISMLATHGVASEALLTPKVLAGLWSALAAALFMNVSIVGTNQLFDIDIDEVNKPYLPLASKEFSPATGSAIVAACTMASFLIGWMSGSPALMATLFISWLLGLVYSVELPFMRWKRSPLLAAGCILSVRALAVQLGFYWHMRHVLCAADALSILSWSALAGTAASLPFPVIFTVGFMLLFSIVIALFKDIPDAPGDRQAGVETLTVQLGTAVPFWICIWTLTLAYVGACGYSVVMASLGIQPGMVSLAGSPASLSMVAALPIKALVSILGHAVLATLLWWQALKVDLSKKGDITACYMHVWKLFYAEYMLIPFFA